MLFKEVKQQEVNFQKVFYINYSTAAPWQKKLRELWIQIHAMREKNSGVK